MSRVVHAMLLAAASASMAPSATRADQSSAESVLRDAGLLRRSPSYVLQGELEAMDLADGIRRLEDQLVPLMQKYRGLKGDYEAKNAEASRLSNEARVVSYEYNSQTKRYDEKVQIDESKSAQSVRVGQEADRIRMAALALEPEIAAAQREIQRAWGRHAQLVNRTLGEYSALAGRPDIKAALRELNRGTRPKQALGPVEAYRANVLRQSVDTMAALGCRREGDLFWLSEEADLIKQCGLAHQLWREVSVPERGAAPPNPAAAPAKRPIAARPPTALDPAAAATPAAVAPALKESPPAQAAARRAELVRRVRQLRRQADALQARRDALIADVEARDALDEINRATTKAHQVKIGGKSGLKVAIQQLEAIERSIRSEVIPLTRDGERLRVPVRINGHPASMVVDPSAARVSLPDPMATELGVQPATDARTVPPAPQEARAIEARRARIATLQLGSFAVEGVECLVSPAGPGDDAPVLGASFLDRLVAELDAGTATLTLSRVDPPPSAPAPRPAANVRNR